MKRSIFIIALLVSILPTIRAQSQIEEVFTTVPEVNGKVVFQQFIHANQGLSENQKYALLYKWGKDNFAGNPLLSGIRFNEKEKSVTVSSKVELILPKDGDGNRQHKVMNYRFDASVTNAGCMLIIRDITYQDTEKSKSFFPKLLAAEEMITDSAINSDMDSKELKENLRKSTLYFFNELYSDIKKTLSVSN